jgi:VanZ family protein
MMVLKTYYKTIIWFVIMVYLLFSPSSGLPKTGMLDFPHADKLVHGVMFAILSFVYAFDSEVAGRNLYKAALLFSAIGLAFAALSEYIQHAFIPGRYGNVYDLLSDVAGIILGFLAYFILGRKMTATLRIKKSWELIGRRAILPTRRSCLATFEIGIQKNFSNFFGCIQRNKPCRHSTNVGIIMLTCQFRNFHGPAKGRANTLVFINRHVNAISTATQSKTQIKLSFFNSLCERMCKVGVIDAVGCVRTKISNLVTHTLYKIYKFCFHVNPCMIAGNSYVHCF